jgi:3-methylcrotonyl-CoA carboxylase alpha subunit
VDPQVLRQIDIMSTHTAIATTSLGVIDAVQVPTEKPGPGEVLLKVAYASLMAFDVYVMDAGFFVQEYPVTLGFNSSGTVVQVGAGVDDIKVGDRVSDRMLLDLRNTNSIP